MNIIGYLKDNSTPMLLFAALIALHPIMELTGFVYTDIMTRIFILALFAMSFDLVLGYTGLLNFGHTLFFGLGAYITGYTILYLGQHYLIGLVLGMLVCVGIAIGVSLLVSRFFKGIPFTFMSLAILMITLFFYTKEIIPPKYGMGSGGGISISLVEYPHGFFFSFKTTILAAGIGFALLIVLSWIGTTFKFKDIDFKSGKLRKIGMLIGTIALSGVTIYAIYHGLTELSTVGSASERLIPNKYYFTVFVVALSYFAMKRIVNSPVGHIWTSIRENETRAEIMGYRIFNYKMLALIIGGLFAGLAGGLYVPYIGALDPNGVLEPLKAIDAIIFIILGGLGTLAGGLVGGGIVIMFEEITNPYIGEWNYVIIGIIFIIVVYLAPRGILGTARSERAREKVKERLSSFVDMIRR